MYPREKAAARQVEQFGIAKRREALLVNHAEALQHHRLLIRPDDFEHPGNQKIESLQALDEKTGPLDLPLVGAEEFQGLLQQRGVLSAIGEQALAVSSAEARIRFIEVDVEVVGILLFCKHKRVPAHESRDVAPLPLPFGRDKKVLVLPDTEQSNRKQRAAFLAGKGNRVLPGRIEKLDRGERYRVGLLGEAEIAGQRAKPGFEVHVRIELNGLLVKEQRCQ